MRAERQQQNKEMMKNRKVANNLILLLLLLLSFIVAAVATSSSISPRPPPPPSHLSPPPPPVLTAHEFTIRATENTPYVISFDGVFEWRNQTKLERILRELRRGNNTAANKLTIHITTSPSSGHTLCHYLVNTSLNHDFDYSGYDWNTLAPCGREYGERIGLGAVVDVENRGHGITGSYDDDLRIVLQPARNAWSSNSSIIGTFRYRVQLDSSQYNMTFISNIAEVGISVAHVRQPPVAVNTTRILSSRVTILQNIELKGNSPEYGAGVSTAAGSDQLEYAIVSVPRRSRLYIDLSQRNKRSGVDYQDGLIGRKDMRNLTLISSSNTSFTNPFRLVGRGVRWLYYDASDSSSAASPISLSSSSYDEIIFSATDPANRNFTSLGRIMFRVDCSSGLGAMDEEMVRNVWLMQNLNINSTSSSSSSLSSTPLCLPCPSGASCSILGEYIPRSLPGFWQLPPPSSSPSVTTQQPIFIECAPKDACISVPIRFPISAANISESNLSTSSTFGCALGYSGDYCASCQASYYRYRGVCHRCDSTSSLIMSYLSYCIPILLLFLLLILLIIHYRLDSSCFFTAVQYYQLIAIFYCLFDMNWPSSVSSTNKSESSSSSTMLLFSFLSFFHLNIDLLRVECFMSPSTSSSVYFMKWIVIACLPLIFVVIFFLLMLIRTAVNVGRESIARYRTQRNRSPAVVPMTAEARSTPSASARRLSVVPANPLPPSSWRFFLSTSFRTHMSTSFSHLACPLLLILHTLFLPVLLKALEITQCEKRSDGSKYLIADPGVVCEEEWIVWRDVGWMLFSLYSGGFLLLYASIYLISHRINLKYIPLLQHHQQQVKFDSIIPSPELKRQWYDELTHFQQRYSTCLILSHSSIYSLMLVAAMFILAMTSVLLQKYATLQVFIAVIILAVWLLTLRCGQDNKRFELRCLHCAFLVLFLGLLFHGSAPSIRYPAVHIVLTFVLYILIILPSLTVIYILIQQICHLHPSSRVSHFCATSTLILSKFLLPWKWRFSSKEAAEIQMEHQRKEWERRFIEADGHGEKEEETKESQSLNNTEEKIDHDHSHNSAASTTVDEHSSEHKSISPSPSPSASPQLSPSPEVVSIEPFSVSLLLRTPSQPVIDLRTYGEWFTAPVTIVEREAFKQMYFSYEPEQDEPNTADIAFRYYDSQLSLSGTSEQCVTPTRTRTPSLNHSGNDTHSPTAAQPQRRGSYSLLASPFYQNLFLSDSEEDDPDHDQFHVPESREPSPEIDAVGMKNGLSRLRSHAFGRQLTLEIGEDGKLQQRQKKIQVEPIQVEPIHRIATHDNETTIDIASTPFLTPTIVHPPKSSNHRIHIQPVSAYARSKTDSRSASSSSTVSTAIPRSAGANEGTVSSARLPIAVPVSANAVVTPSFGMRLRRRSVLPTLAPSPEPQPSPSTSPVEFETESRLVSPSLEEQTSLLSSNSSRIASVDPTTASALLDAINSSNSDRSSSPPLAALLSDSPFAFFSPLTSPTSSSPTSHLTSALFTPSPPPMAMVDSLLPLQLSSIIDISTPSSIAVSKPITPKPKLRSSSRIGPLLSSIHLQLPANTGGSADYASTPSSTNRTPKSAFSSRSRLKSSVSAAAAPPSPVCSNFSTTTPP